MKTAKKPRVPHLLLRLEGAAFLFAALIIYVSFGWSLVWLVILFFVPDVSMIGYLKNPRIGSYLYNLGHTYFIPALIAMTSFLLGFTLGLQISVIWFAHIGMDRMLGYGLKYPTRFKDTHLQHV